MQHDLNVLPQDIPGQWITIYGPGNASFSPSETDPMARATVDTYGEFLFRWEVREGFCTGEDSVLVSFLREPIANAGPDQVLDYRFTTYLAAELLSADVAAVNTTCTWSLVGGSGVFANPNDPLTQVSGLKLGENVFQWTISSDYCPDVSDRVMITVNDVETFTVITPNNDGFNDKLVFPGIEELQGCEIIIYNRWGMEVYRNADYQNNWDGRDHNNRELIPDAYYYILRIPPDRIIKSFVEIRRSQ
jgi:gliding motility-associated-like protein